MTIRRVPEDFRVQERLTAAWRSSLRTSFEESHPHAIFELHKVSLTTPEATQRLAKALKLKAGEVAAAGLKDKHASTSQFVSVRVKPAAIPPQSALTGPNWSATLAGWAPAEIDAAAIDCNAFTIVVRDLTRERNQRMNEGLRRLSPARDDSALSFLNYFGDQRFGSARHGDGLAGPKLCKGDFEAALKLLIGTPARKDTGARRQLTRACATHWGNWKTVLANSAPHSERRAVEVLASGGTFRDAFEALPSFLQQLSVEAYQSSLWNRTLARMCTDAALTPERGNATSADGICETLLFPDSKLLPASWRGLEVPMLSPAVHLVAPWGDAATAELKQEDLTPRDLRIPGLRRPAFGEAMRPMLATAREVSVAPPEKDSFEPKRLARTMSFTLPRGAYATVLLRALGE